VGLSPRHDDWRRLANEIAATVPVDDPRDWQLVADVAAAVVAGRLSEADCREALESVRLRSPARPGAWLLQVLRNRIEQRGQLVGRVLRRCEYAPPSRS